MDSGDSCLVVGFGVGDKALAMLGECIALYITHFIYNIFLLLLLLFLLLIHSFLFFVLNSPLSQSIGFHILLPILPSHPTGAQG